jgi:hypothetical protein
MQHCTPYPLSRRLVAMGALLVFAFVGAVLSDGAMREHGKVLERAASGDDAGGGEDVMRYDTLMAALERVGRVEAVRPENGSGARGLGGLATPPTATAAYAD